MGVKEGSNVKDMVGLISVVKGISVKVCVGDWVGSIISLVGVGISTVGDVIRVGIWVGAEAFTLVETGFDDFNLI